MGSRRVAAAADDADQAGYARPDATQRLLRTAVWDAEQAQADIRGFVSERSGDAQAVLALDETGDPKKGTPVGRGAATVLGHRGSDRERAGHRVRRLHQPARAHQGREADHRFVAVDGEATMSAGSAGAAALDGDTCIDIHKLFIYLRLR